MDTPIREVQVRDEVVHRRIGSHRSAEPGYGGGAVREDILRILIIAVLSFFVQPRCLRKFV